MRAETQLFIIDPNREDRKKFELVFMFDDDRTVVREIGVDNPILYEFDRETQLWDLTQGERKKIAHLEYRHLGNGPYAQVPIWRVSATNKDPRIGNHVRPEATRVGPFLEFAVPGDKARVSSCRGLIEGIYIVEALVALDLLK